jgi:hypothetical protein
MSDIDFSDDGTVLDLPAQSRSAEGDEANEPSHDKQVATTPWRRACTVLTINSYQRPLVRITEPRVHFSMGPQVEKIQLRHAASGAISYFYSGPATVDEGDYVLSLFGNTFGLPSITACIQYR